MTPTVSKQQVKSLVGKHVYALRKDGTVVEGKLVSVKGNTLKIVQANGKQVSTKAFIPLVLFDLLAIGTSPFAFGPWGFGGGFGFGGFPGFWW